VAAPITTVPPQAAQEEALQVVATAAAKPTQTQTQQHAPASPPSATSHRPMPIQIADPNGAQNSANTQ
jgi:hypothetical protein